MKKYVKPMLYYERFELSQHVAACGFDMNSSAETACRAIGDPEFGYENVVILGAWCGDGDITEIGGLEYCYQNGSSTDPTFRVFNS